MADDTPTTPGTEIERALLAPGIPAECAYTGCTAKTDNRLRWSYLMRWPGGLPDGYYCPVHRDALEGIVVEGGFDDPEFLGFLPELNKESDRGQVLISCSYLDELLRQTLLAFFIEDDNSNRLVEGFNAPLGTFSTRLSTAFALGLISEREFKECNTLRRIRNRFAHHVQASFDMQEIRDLCQNLTYAAQDYGTVTVDIRSRYSTAAIALILNLTNRPHYVSKKRRAFQDWPYSKARLTAAVEAAERWFRREPQRSRVVIKASDALPFVHRNYPDVDAADVIRELGDRLRRRYVR